MLKLSTKFREILPCAHGNFEEHYVLEPSIIINYCITVISAYYNYIV